MKNYLSFLIIIVLFQSCDIQQAQYIKNSGLIFGTYYQLTYESPNGEDLHAEVKDLLNQLDNSFSTYNPNSTVSKVNQNIPVQPDTLFFNVFNKAQEISSLTNGAFDATVAPMVNAWGFGFKKKENITQQRIDSIKAFTGYSKVHLENGKIIKEDPRLMLDFSAIAKGYSVDIVADFLRKKGCSNCLVDIGGEVAAFGQNPSGATWRVGINEPNDNEPVNARELQAITSLKNKAMATSGNYRNFYIENGEKFAHTINPKTGYPVNHNLLSATIVTDDCMTADALATACMVIGTDSAQKLISELDNVETFLIYANKTGTNQVFMTDGFQDLIINE
ncbi:MAG: FAD:protein FMN transferase [Prolixibacteraceae bacterium]|nr:FAD:protein FMN transferase [Prolixibacteraceae bacterium]